MVLALKNKHALKHLLKATKLAKSVFYYQVKINDKPDTYERELALIKNIYHEHKGRYGYRRIHLTLKREGITLNHKTVQKLMAQLNLKSTVRPKKYSSYKGVWEKQRLMYLNETLMLRSQIRRPDSDRISKPGLTSRLTKMSN